MRVTLLLVGSLTLACAGTLGTLAGGTGWASFSGNATSASLPQIQAIAANATGGVFFIALGAPACVLRAVSPNGTISTFAGVPFSCGYGGNGGAATSALLSGNLYGLAVDPFGAVYVSDSASCVVRKISPSGTITLFAGTVGVCSPYQGDGGAATSAHISPRALAIDASGTRVFIIASADAVRMVQGGIISLFAGSPNDPTYARAWPGDGAQAANGGYFMSACSLAVDSAANGGNVYILDCGYCTVRIVTPGGLINTFAGTRPVAPSYVPQCGWTGDGGPATSAMLGSRVTSIAFTGSSNLVIGNAGGNGCSIRLVTTSAVDPGGTMSTIAGHASGGCGYGGGAGGPATSAMLSPNQLYVAADASGRVLVGDFSNKVVWSVTAASPRNISIVAGSANCGDGGAATSAYVQLPQTIAVDSTTGAFYFSSPDLTTVRAVVGGVITTIAGVTLGCTYTPSCYGGDGGPATLALLRAPTAVATYSGPAGRFLFVSDAGNSCVRRVDLASGTIVTVAGTPTVLGMSGWGGPATSATLGTIKSIGVAPDGTLFLQDGYYNVILRLGADGLLTLFAGAANVWAFSGNGVPLINASFGALNSISVDAAGNLYVTDSCLVRRIDAAAPHIVSAAAGVLTGANTSANCGYNGDSGAATAIMLSAPFGVTPDPMAAGGVFVADVRNCVIRRVGGGVTTVFAGLTSIFCAGAGSSDGGAATAPLGTVNSIAFDSGGNLLFSEENNAGSFGSIRVVWATPSP